MNINCFKLESKFIYLYFMYKIKETNCNYNGLIKKQFFWGYENNILISLVLWTQILLKIWL